jgi:C1A family cysteine protease
MITPGGHWLGGKRDRPDADDHRYGVTVRGPAKPIKPASDMRLKLPPAFNQGEMASCGANAGSGLMTYLFPECTKIGFSRLQIYADVRTLEGDFSEDSGVETRDVLKVLCKTGAALETRWPYDPAKLFVHPPAAMPRHKLKSYARLVADNDMLSCLSSGLPFLLGFQCFSSIDSDDLARTGVMPMPDMANEKQVGGHDVLVVGHDIRFKDSEVFKKSGVDPARMTDEALLIRNSWGVNWGIAGHFWMPLLYASNPSVGGDAWMGKRF